MKHLFTDLHINHLGWLIGISILVKSVFYVIYAPGIYGDTSGYIEMVRIIQTNAWDTFDGLRTPGYPVFLMLLGSNIYFVTVVQSFLGLGTVIMVFMIGKELLQNQTKAFWLGILCLSTVNTLFMDMTILTESLTSFLLVLTTCLSLYLVKSNSPWYLWLSMGLGVVIGFALLVRPNLLIVVLIVMLWVVYSVRYKLRLPVAMQMLCLACFLVPVVCAYMGWSYVSSRLFDTFQYSNTSGIYLTSHTGSYVEFADNNHSLIRDRVLEIRHEGYTDFYKIFYPTSSGIAHHKAHAAEWHVAYDLIEDGEFDSLADVNSIFLDMNLDLILDHPLWYLDSVYESFIRFGLGENLGFNHNFRVNGLDTLFRLVWMVQVVLIRAAFLLAYLVTLLLVLVLAKRQQSWIPMFTLLVCLMIVSSGLLQALVINVANNRMGLPFQPLVFLVVAYGISELRVLGRLTIIDRKK